MTESETVIATILTAAFNLAARDGWYSMTPQAVADETGLPLALIYQHVETAPALLGLLARYADSQVLAEPAPGESRTRDNLFDLLMRRFDALTPYRDGIRHLWRQWPRLPVTLVVGGPQLAVSMSLMLDAAGDRDESVARKIRVLGLTGLWSRTFLTWLKDDSADLSRTMASLDRDLNTAEMLAHSMADGSLAVVRDVIGSIQRYRNHQKN